MGIQEFVEGLDADFVEEIGPKGRALSVTEALATIGYYNARMKRLHDEEEDHGRTL